jgi:ketosteroid isomerase-like protein
MAQEDVDRIRASWEAWNRGDPGPTFEVLAPDVVFEDPGVPDSVGEVYHGHDGVLKAWQRWSEPWQEFTTELEEIYDGGDKVVSIHRADLRGKESGAPTTLRYCYVYTIRDGRVSHFRTYFDREEALAAAGVSE